MLHLIKPRDQVSTHVVFVHGLGGDWQKTWTSPSAEKPGCWLDWLAEDNPTWAIYSLGHHTPKLGRSSSLSEKARIAVNELDRKIGPHSQPIVFVTHSFGGLLAKAIACYLDERNRLDPTSKSERVRPENISGIVFLGTPHRPTAHAKIAAVAEKIFKLGLTQLASKLGWLAGFSGSIARTLFSEKVVLFSQAVNELGNDFLLHRSRESYRDVHNRFQWDHLVLFETEPLGFSIIRYPFGVVVDEVDASLELTGQKYFTSAAEGEDHFSIAAPIAPGAGCYDTVQAFIRNLVERGQERDAAPQPIDAPSRIYEYVGRDYTFLEPTKTGDPRVAVIQGPSGSGKTQLLAARWAEIRQSGLIGYRHANYYPIGNQSGQGSYLSFDDVISGVYSKVGLHVPSGSNFRSLTRAYKEQYSAVARHLVVIDGIEAATQKIEGGRIRLASRNEAFLRQLSQCENTDLVIITQYSLHADVFGKNSTLKVILLEGYGDAEAHAYLQDRGIYTKHLRTLIIEQCKSANQNRCHPMYLTLTAWRAAAYGLGYAEQEAPPHTEMNKLAWHVNQLFRMFDKWKEEYDCAANLRRTGYLEQAIACAASLTERPLSRSEVRSLIFDSMKPRLSSRLVDADSVNHELTSALRTLVDVGVFTQTSYQTTPNEELHLLELNPGLRREIRLWFARDSNIYVEALKQLEQILEQRLADQTHTRERFRQSIDILFDIANCALEQGDASRSFRNIYLERIQNWNGQWAEKNRLWGSVNAQNLEWRYFSRFIDVEDLSLHPRVKLDADLQPEFYHYAQVAARGLGEINLANRLLEKLLSQLRERGGGIPLGRVEQYITHTCETCIVLGQIPRAVALMESVDSLQIDKLSGQEFQKARLYIFRALALAIQSADQATPRAVASFMERAQKYQHALHAQDEEKNKQTGEPVKQPQYLVGVQGYFCVKLLLYRGLVKDATEYAEYLVAFATERKLQGLSLGLAHLAVFQCQLAQLRMLKSLQAIRRVLLLCAEHAKVARAKLAAAPEQHFFVECLVAEAHLHRFVKDWKGAESRLLQAYEIIADHSYLIYEPACKIEEALLWLSRSDLDPRVRQQHADHCYETASELARRCSAGIYHGELRELETVLATTC